MTSYVVNKEAQSQSGDHEVHDLASTKGCLPSPENQLFLGNFMTCAEAIREARKYFSDVDGCAHCAAACHTS